MNATEGQLVSLRGVVSKVIYSSADGGYGIVQLKVQSYGDA